MLRLRIAVLLLCIAPAARAANLLVNSNFEAGFAGWKPSAPYAQVISGWQRADASFSPDSGSLVVTLNAVSSSYVSMMQCVAVTPGADYDAGVKMMIVGGQTPGRGGLLLRLYPSADCSGSPLSSQIATWDVGQPANGRFTPVALRDVGMPSNVHSVGVELIASCGGPGSIAVNFDDAYFALAGGCVPDDRMLCLDGGRFAVSASYTAPGATSKPAHMVQLTPDTAYMWFFDPNNVEVTIKALNACSISANHWVFSSGLTNVDVDIIVTDTLTGARREYRNPQGTFYQPHFDTTAFSCP